MINHYDIAYGLGVGISSPFWLAHPRARRKVLSAFSQRMGRVPSRDLSRPGIMVHAVSLGEINATRSLIEVLRTRRPEAQFIVSVTTESGYAQGAQLYGKTPDVTLVRYPLDFTPAVDRLLMTLRPAVVALMELEVWPNFIRRCGQLKTPVLLINGRITPGSFRKYRMARPVVGSMFARLHWVAAQDANYAKRFEELGVPKRKISVTGTMKFDTASISDRLPGQDELAAAVGLDPQRDRIWVCGSTGPGEEAIVLPIYRRLLEKYPNLRLVIVPRHKERFDEAAKLIAEAGFSLVRRSGTLANPVPADKSAVILGDTFGELAKFYALAEIAFVGRSLVDLGHKQHGSDMIEPAALAKPVIVGPFTANFAAAVNYLVTADAMVVVESPEELLNETEKLLTDAAGAKTMGERAREVVKNGQGATARHADLILDTLDSLPTMSRR